MELNNLSTQLGGNKLRIMPIGGENAEVINVCVTESSHEVQISKSESLESDKAYFLPWEKNAGLYIILSDSNVNVKAFFTPMLTGCFIGISKIGNEVKIGHYNYFDLEGPKEFDFSHYQKWLIPDTSYNVPQNSLYEKYKYSCTFWGEYNNNEWKFYYQYNCPGKKEHLQINSFNFK